jgi:hypothetical protein
MNFTGSAQNYYPGKLNIQVDNPSGIPNITIDAGDTLIRMENTMLQEIYHSNNVYSFELVFPDSENDEILKKYGLDRVYELQCNCDVEQLKNQILEESGRLYKYVERTPVYTLAYEPNDYHLLDLNPLQGIDSALNLINAQEAWEKTHGDSSIKIGITDCNIYRPNHEDILGKVNYWDTTGGDNCEFHGLFVCGSAAGATNNGVGKSSIGFNCSILLNSHRGSNSISKM